MKLCNFLHLDPGYSGEGLASVNTMDRSVWEQFSTKKEELHVSLSQSGLLSGSMMRRWWTLLPKRMKPSFPKAL